MRPGVACNAQDSPGTPLKDVTNYTRKLRPVLWPGTCLFALERSKVETLNIGEGVLLIGWKAVGGAVGRSAHYLTQAHAQGRLSVEPMRIGAQVAYTHDMAEDLRTSLEARATSHTRRAVRAEEAIAV